MAVRYVGTVRYASIFAEKYGTLVRYVFFVMVRVRYVGTVRFKNSAEVRYAGTVRLKVRGTYYTNSERTVPYCHPCMQVTHTNDFYDRSSRLLLSSLDWVG